MKTIVRFVAGSLVFAAPVLAIAFVVGGDETLVRAAAAFGLAFVPAALTLAWVVQTYRTDPGMMLMASLGGSGIRMAAALGGAVFLTQTFPQEFDGSFWYWLVLFYLALLAFEIALLVRQDGKLNEAPKA